MKRRYSQITWAQIGKIEWNWTFILDDYKIEETDAKQIEHANHYTTQNKTRKQKNKLSLHTSRLSVTTKSGEVISNVVTRDELKHVRTSNDE